MQGADFGGDAEDERQTREDQRQRDVSLQKELNDQATAGKQAAADNQAFKEAFMRRIQPGNVAAGGN